MGHIGKLVLITVLTLVVYNVVKNSFATFLP